MHCSGLFLTGSTKPASQALGRDTLPLKQGSARKAECVLGTAAKVADAALLWCR